MTSNKNLSKETAFQTAGPYVHIGCTPNFSDVKGVYKEDLGSNLIFGDVKGTEITIKGTVFDGDGLPLLDALIEIWQADAHGVYNTTLEANSYFTGWGRSASNMRTGEFQFTTIKPGQVAYANGDLQAPHITFWIVARGINIGLHTRMYFADENIKNAADPLLKNIPDQNRVATLLAHSNRAGGYHFDIHLQGANETVFLDI